MKKTVIIVVSVLLCAVCATVIGQKKILSPKEERREVREKRRAERIAGLAGPHKNILIYFSIICTIGVVFFQK